MQYIQKYSIYALLMESRRVPGRPPPRAIQPAQWWGPRPKTGTFPRRARRDRPTGDIRRSGVRRRRHAAQEVRICRICSIYADAYAIYPEIYKYYTHIYICNVCNIFAYKIYLQYMQILMQLYVQQIQKYAEMYAEVYAEMYAERCAEICANRNAICAEVYIMHCDSMYALPTLLMESRRVRPPAIAQPGRAPCGRPSGQA
jgi:hypothetical protein